MYFILHFKIKKKTNPIASGSIILLNNGRQMYYNGLAILAKTKVLMTSRHVNYDSC